MIVGSPGNELHRPMGLAVGERLGVIALPNPALPVNGTAPQPTVQDQEVTVTGIVIDERTGQPLPGATVRSTVGSATTRTGNDGRFLLRLPATTDELEASSPGYVPSRMSVEAAGGKLAPLRFELARITVRERLRVLAGEPGVEDPGTAALEPELRYNPDGELPLLDEQRERALPTFGVRFRF